MTELHRGLGPIVPASEETEHFTHCQFNIFALRHGLPNKDYARLSFDGVMQATRTAQQYVDNLLQRGARSIHIWPYTSPLERSDDTLRVFLNIVHDHITAGVVENVTVHETSPFDDLDTTKLVRPFLEPGMTTDQAIEAWFESSGGITYDKVVERLVRLGQRGISRLDPTGNTDHDFIASTHSPTNAALNRYFFPNQEVQSRYAELFQLQFQKGHLVATSDQGHRAVMATK